MFFDLMKSNFLSQHKFQLFVHFQQAGCEFFIFPPEGHIPRRHFLITTFICSSSQGFRQVVINLSSVDRINYSFNIRVNPSEEFGSVPGIFL